MSRTLRLSGVTIIIMAVIAFLAGVAVIGVAFTKQAWMQDAMKQENVKIASLGVKGVGPDEIIDNGEKAQIAADTVKAHRHSIAASYSDLLAGGKFDPTNPMHLTYSQAINLENYLYLGVLGFGVVQLALGAGAFMVLTALALGVIGMTFLKLARQKA